MADRLPDAGRWLLRWGLLMLLWLALTDTRNVQDVLAGAVAAALAASLAGLVTRRGAPKPVAKSFGLLRLGPRRLLRPLGRLVADTGLLTVAVGRRLLGREVRGSFRAVRYRPDEPRRSAAGRALTEVWGSLMPNRYVVGTDDEEGLLLVHELVPTDEPVDPLGRR